MSPHESENQGILEQACRTVATWLVDANPFARIDEIVLTARGPVTARSLPAMGTRATNTIARQLSGIDLVALTPGEIADLRGVGRLTAIEIVDSIVRCLITEPPSSSGSLPMRAAPDWAEGLVDQESWGSESNDFGLQAMFDKPAPGLDPRHEVLLDDVLVVASWLLTRGDGSERVFAQLNEEPVPDEVAAAQARLLKLRAVDLVDRTEAPDAVLDLDVTLATMPSRDLQILRGRFFATNPVTLDELGRQLGVTRERVRQIEAKAVAGLREATAFGGPVGDFLAVLRAEIKSVVPLARLTDRHSNLLNLVQSVEMPLWFVLDRIDDAFEVEDGWAAAPTVEEARAKTREALEDLDNRHGLVRIADLHERLGHKMNSEELAEWVSYCGYSVQGPYVTIRTAIPDRAVAALAIAERPLTSAEICLRIPDRSANSIKNALAVDDRVHRVDRDTWALVEWGHDTYSSIRDMIGKVLDRTSDGRIRFDELAEDLTARFSVSANSVQAYASSQPYSVVDGWVVRAPEKRSARKSPAETRRLYRSGRQWMYRIEVSEDHLRGSGFPVPRGVVDLVECAQGGAVQLMSRWGETSLRWTGLQPSCGTIRPALEELGAQVGDFVFLRIDPETLTVTFEHVSGIDGLSDIDQLRVLCGLGLDQANDLVSDLAVALSLPSGSDAIAVSSALRDRGERELFERALRVLPLGGDGEAPVRSNETASITDNLGPTDGDLIELLGLA